jgi:hypothetical protein
MEHPIRNFGRFTAFRQQLKIVHASTDRHTKLMGIYDVAERHSTPLAASRFGEEIAISREYNADPTRHNGLTMHRLLNVSSHQFAL